jgi:hypothetical protein
MEVLKIKGKLNQTIKTERNTTPSWLQNFDLGKLIKSSREKETSLNTAISEPV